jgi:hypothetical protein
MRKVSAFSDAPSYSEVKDTLEVLDFGFKTQEAISDSLADGKVGLMDLPNVIKPLMVAGAAVDGFQNVKSELKTLSPEGKTIVFDFVRDRFDIPDNQLEVLIEETINEVIGDISVAFKWANYRK